MEKIINKISKVDEIKSLYKNNYEDLKKSSNFWKKTLDILNIDYYAEHITNIPKTGSAIVVANHPFGLLDGLIICSIIFLYGPNLIFSFFQPIDMLYRHHFCQNLLWV